MSKYTKSTLQKLEAVFTQLGYRVRYEKGTFKSGYCVVEDRKIVVINRFFDSDGRVQTMLDILSSMEVDDSLIDATTRSFIDRLLARVAASGTP